MNNDIFFEKNDIVFNYRVAIIIKNNDKILVQKNNLVNYYTLPGGRCNLLENSIETALREFQEETGIICKFVRPIGIVENFFTSKFNNKKYHEILIVHELEFKDKKYYECDTIFNIEVKNKDNLSYIWVSINKLKESNFEPKILLDMLNKNEFQHYINKNPRLKDVVFR